MLDYEKLPSRTFFFDGSGFISIDDARPQSSSIDVSPPPPPTACLFICLFFKKRNGTGMHRGAIQSGNPAIRECSYPGESYIIIINPSVCYIYAPSECIDEKRRGEKPQAGPTGRPPARALSYWHSLPSFIIDTGGRSAIDCGTRHPCHPDTFNPVNFYFVRHPWRWG
jgi:hypothetical protein